MMTGFLAYLWLAVAAAAQLQLSPRATELTVGETIPLDLQLVDGATRGVPEIPTGEGLRVQFQGQSQSRMIVNFQSTTIIRYSYALTAMQPGSWQIGPVTVQDEDSGRPVSAPAVTVTVAERSMEAQATRDVTASVSEPEPFLGQVVVYRLRFQHQGDVLDARWEPPEFDGFVREQVAEAVQREVPVTRDGVQFTVQDVELPLVAAGEGPRTVPPTLLTALFPDERQRRSGRRDLDVLLDSPFRRYGETRQEQFATSPIPVTVRPLPTEGRPADFSGLVGRFAVTSTPSATEIAVGDSLTLEVTVSGDGTLAGFRLPPAPDDAGFRAYDDEAEINARVAQGAFAATATVRRAIVPEREGRLVIPPIEIKAFDPETEQYVKLASSRVEVNVLPGEAGAGEVTSFYGEGGDNRRVVANLGEDILPAPGGVSVGDRTLEGSLGSVLGPPAGAALALLGLWLSGLTFRRRVDPWGGVRATLSGLPSDPEARLSALEDAFRAAAGIRLGRPAAGLEREAVAALGPEAEALYADLEKARYGGLAVADLEARVRAFVGQGVS